MIVHPEVNVLILAGGSVPEPAPLITYLRGMPQMHLTVMPNVPGDLRAFDVVVTGQTAVFSARAPSLEQFVREGGGWLGLVDGLEKPLPQIFGARPSPLGPEAEIRVMFHDQQHPLSIRLPDALYADGRFQALEAAADDTDIVLYADWHYQHKPVLVSRQVGNGIAACTTLQAYDLPVFQQILGRLICSLAGKAQPARILGIGILGYAPWVSLYHGMGAGATPGLELRAVCDINPARLAQARADFDGVKAYTSSELLKKDPAVDIVIVATAPNIHAQLCLEMMAAGKHVVCEKPLALTAKEAETLVEASESLKLHVSCHQNRRWDVDFLAIRQALAHGLLGDLFHMETFVGGFSHPCGYWHSHAPISGGTAYDWGGQYIDWIVNLMAGRAVSVTCTSHKRVWHDVTNSDQERIIIRFAGGREAEFMHSDIAAIRKPKWYLLGTEGAIIGQWQDVTTFDVDPVLYFNRHDIPATEMPPQLSVCRRVREGEISTQKLPLPARRDYAFHRNLADHLLTGEPIEAPLAQSVSVVKILEAASRSADRGGAEVHIDA
jgi:predicted dehydrogenase